MENDIIIPPLTQEIITLHNQLVANLKIELFTAIQIGEKLLIVKASLPHGQFEKWIRDNMPFTDRTARNYMRLFENKELLKTENVSDLTKAYKMLEEPKELQIHELCAKIPFMSPEEFAQLKYCIQKHGYDEKLGPIWLYEGKILDGKCRYKACRELGVSPIFKEYTGDDPINFVLTENVYRQSYTKDDILVYTVKMIELIEDSIEKALIEVRISNEEAEQWRKKLKKITNQKLISLDDLATLSDELRNTLNSQN